MKPYERLKLKIITTMNNVMQINVNGKWVRWK